MQRSGDGTRIAHLMTVQWSLWVTFEESWKASPFGRPDPTVFETLVLPGAAERLAGPSRGPAPVVSRVTDLTALGHVIRRGS